MLFIVTRHYPQYSQEKRHNKKHITQAKQNTSTMSEVEIRSWVVNDCSIWIVALHRQARHRETNRQIDGQTATGSHHILQMFVCVNYLFKCLSWFSTRAEKKMNTFGSSTQTQGGWVTVIKQEKIEQTKSTRKQKKGVARRGSHLQVMTTSRAEKQEERRRRRSGLSGPI